MKTGFEIKNEIVLYIVIVTSALLGFGIIAAPFVLLADANLGALGAFLALIATVFGIFVIFAPPLIFHSWVEFPWEVAKYLTNDGRRQYQDDAFFIRIESSSDYYEVYICRADRSGIYCQGKGTSLRNCTDISYSPYFSRRVWEPKLLMAAVKQYRQERSQYRRKYSF